MLKAALSHFVAMRDKAVANLNNVLNNSAGIGEHVDLVGEVITLVEELERANSCIVLLSNMSPSEAPQAEPEPEPDEE